MSTSQLQFESPTESLADSFVSTPGALFSSSFDVVDPEVMTPQSFDDDSLFDCMTGTPAPEKKQTKKRKSWGQQLPEPKTNLPPRKRAKTEDEKEQRRVERVLRNRRAAQSSRERKRQEVEALEAKMNEKERINQDIERKNRDLELQLAAAQAKNIALQQQLELAQSGNMTVFRGSAASSPAHVEQFRRAPSPVTLSQDLFGSREAEPLTYPTQISEAQSPLANPPTVNPASLSPEMRPVVDDSNASSSDLTQHPAVSVGRTTALEFDHSASTLASPDAFQLGNHAAWDFYDAPQPTAGDIQFFEEQIFPLTNDLNFDLNHMVDDHPSNVNFDINDFVNDFNDQSAPVLHASDAVVESTTSLQPQFGASLDGCDDGGNAVRV